MDFLQSLLDSSGIPVVTAFLLGLMTAISPCPLATNIAAVGFISKNIDSRRRIFCTGLLYTAGRIIGYTVLGLILLAFIDGGGNMFGIQKFLGRYGEKFIGPLLLVVGLFMLFGDRLRLPSFGFKGGGEKLASRCSSSS